MTTTFTLPDGATVRTATKSRFVLIRHAEAEGCAPVVVKRSGSTTTLFTERRRRGFHTGVRFYLGDTVDRTVKAV